MGQHTIGRPVVVHGVALHGGNSVCAEIRPAPPNTGIRFLCADSADSVPIPALLESVVDSQLATTLGVNSCRIRTVEHLLAAVRGIGIDNLEVIVSGGEIPALDGSAAQWVSHLKRAGRVDQGISRCIFVVKEAVSVRDGARHARVEPNSGLSVDMVIDFDHPDVGRQQMSLDLDNGTFIQEVAWARTFGFLDRVAAMRRMGLVRGGSLENAVVYGDDGVINPGGLRGPGEPIRHKILDLLGDVVLLGHPVRARFVLERPGHGLVLRLLTELQSRSSAWCLLEENSPCAPP